MADDEQQDAEKGKGKHQDKDQRKQESGQQGNEKQGGSQRQTRQSQKNTTPSPGASRPYIQIARALFGEYIGTMILTFAAAGPLVMGVAAGHPLSQISRLLPQGFMVAALIYVLGNVSGAHLNPAVTFAFWVRRDFPWWLVPGYWLAQLLGGFSTGAYLYLVFGQVNAVGSDLPSKHLSQWVAMVTEAALTTILVLVILATAHEHKLIGLNAALAVGLALAALGVIASPVSGASMNPARSFGPAVFGHALHYIWIYTVGPMTGSFLACGIEWGLRGGTNPDAQKVAQGL